MSDALPVFVSLTPSQSAAVSSAPAPGGGAEGVWGGSALPHKALFLAMLVGWSVLFQLYGTSTLGYVNTPSLFGWWWRVSTRDLHGAHWNPAAVIESEESFVFLAPFIVLALYWVRRAEFLALPKRLWWPALGLFALSLGFHVTGYMVQQARLSMIAFFGGVYALSGLVWGPAWLRASFFPFLLFGFCLPLANQADYVTFPLRVLATKISVFLCHTGLGISVIQDGTRIFDSTGTYQYEVAAACSGIRSLIATVALAIVYGFLTFRTSWRRWVMLGSAFPLAVAANVVRLTTIIIAAEAFGQEAGNAVHHSSWFSLVPYGPAILGVILLGHWLREDRHKRPNVPEPLAESAR